jgi:deazaflavin-dependent oxidoreductase (nitroreductase family)
MDDRVKDALQSGQVIDITTQGRTSGAPRRIEIWFHNLDGRIYITGRPGQRDWYANLRANPNMVFHLKRGVTADLPARALPIGDPAAKRAILDRVLQLPGWSGDLEEWVACSPLVEVTFDGIA